MVNAVKATAQTTAQAPLRIPRERLPIFLAGLVSLLGALWGGLILLGLSVPTLASTTATDHGPLMALGFLGTVISLERAVALGRTWAFGAPAAAGLGAIMLLLGFSLPGRFLLTVAAIILVVVCVVVYRIQPTVHLIVMAFGAVSWYVAALLWLGDWSIPDLVPWLAGFLVLTILGERLELARVRMITPKSVRQFTVVAVIFGAGLVLSAVPDLTGTAGIRLAGIGLIGLAVWGAVNDVARRTVRIPGLTRFMALCLLAGYAWLLIGGVIWLLAGDLGTSTAAYDAALHAVFLGFVMSMIFAHAPVIVPAVLRVRLPYHPSFYVHAALLHSALIVRLVLGDAAGLEIWWQAGGVGNEIAVLLFLGLSAMAVMRARRNGRLA